MEDKVPGSDLEQQSPQGESVQYRAQTDVSHRRYTGVMGATLEQANRQPLAKVSKNPLEIIPDLDTKTQAAIQQRQLARNLSTTINMFGYVSALGLACAVGWMIKIQIDMWNAKLPNATNAPVPTNTSPASNPNSLERRLAPKAPFVKHLERVQAKNGELSKNELDELKDYAPQGYEVSKNNGIKTPPILPNAPKGEKGTYVDPILLEVLYHHTAPGKYKDFDEIVKNMTELDLYFYVGNNNTEEIIKLWIGPQWMIAYEDYLNRHIGIAKNLQAELEKNNPSDSAIDQLQLNINELQEMKNKLYSEVRSQTRVISGKNMNQIIVFQRAVSASKVIRKSDLV